jgi:carotenoid 1,2-hydratase
VAPGGYAWWYVDALSDDGRYGLTAIAFVGSVFSPYYAWARGRGVADPGDHCALNVALYAPGGGPGRWTMTERGRHAVAREQSALAIGPSRVEWRSDRLVLEIDEVAVPWPARVRGTVVLHPAALTGRSFALDAAGDHRWTPYAPVARVDVRLSSPALRWSGAAYLDGNSGATPLESSFAHWHWSRADLAGRTATLYDVVRQDGSRASLALEFSPDGVAREFDAPAEAALPRTLWRLGRTTRTEAAPDGGPGARLLATLEDAPFYARSLVQQRLLGRPATAVHESLELGRFARPWVRCLLPFRMPRRAR